MGYIHTQAFLLDRQAMVNCKLVFFGFLALVGLCAAAKVDCPVKYEGNNPQMRKAHLTVDIGKDFFVKGWKPELTFNKNVKDVEGPHTRREATKKINGSKYLFENRGYNAILNGGKGPTTLKLHVLESREVRKGQGYAELISARIAESVDDAKWYELCQPEPVATPPPPPQKPPCTDFYNMKMNDAGHGKVTREYEGDLNITFPRPVVGFSFDITFSKADSIAGVDIPNVESKSKTGNVFPFKPWQSITQIKLHEGESVPRWDQSGQANFGRYKVRLNKDLPRKASKVPLPIKIVSKFHGRKGVEKFVTCEGAGL